MKILVIGSGGREHAIVRGIKKNAGVTGVFCAPGNAGIEKDATCVNIAPSNIKDMVEFSVDNSIDYVVVTPDDPLVLGMVDALKAAGISAFGPNKAAARIEGSKIFAKNLMQKYGIPTAKYAVFEEYSSAVDYISNCKKFPLVIKADGLALGKGVVIAECKTEAVCAVDDMMLNKTFGESGSRVVIEQFIQGPEVSVLAFTDGKTIVPMISAMDHKRALDGNHGLNTGGMGTIAPNPHYTAEIAEQCMREIFLPTIAAMEKEGTPFEGCLFFGLMLTKDGPMVIEYNCRFGDPETQVVLPLLKTDLLTIMQGVSNHTLDKITVEFSEKSCACVVMASGGYPVSYQTGYEITGLDANGQRDGAEIFHAGTKKNNHQLVTAGGRVLGVCAVGDNLENSLAKAYATVAKIGFTAAYYRHDIGKY